MYSKLLGGDVVELEAVVVEYFYQESRRRQRKTPRDMGGEKYLLVPDRSWVRVVQGGSPSRRGGGCWRNDAISGHALKLALFYG